MTPEQETTLMIRGAISRFPEELQAQHASLYGEIMVRLSQADPCVAMVTMALIGSEMQEANS